jgi:hypothetical protein
VAGSRAISLTLLTAHFFRLKTSFAYDRRHPEITAHVKAIIGGNGFATSDDGLEV